MAAAWPAPKTHRAQFTSASECCLSTSVFSAGQAAAMYAEAVGADRNTLRL